MFGHSNHKLAEDDLGSWPTLLLGRKKRKHVSTAAGGQVRDFRAAGADQLVLCRHSRVKIPRSVRWSSDAGRANTGEDLRAGHNDLADKNGSYPAAPDFVMAARRCNVDHLIT
jgi:hypothetical protein